MCMFSFVTVCFNAETELKCTMESILSIETDDYEYIVVDGASQDNTVELLKKYDNIFMGKMRWISEKDNGIYDAMNKGIAMSKGKYIVFMNAGDVFLKNSLKKIRETIAGMPGPIDIIYGDTINSYQYGNEVKKVNKKSNPDITLNSLKNGMGVVHQSMFTDRELFKKIGGFNVKYSIGADWDFLIRAVKANSVLQYVPCPFCEFDVNGVSSRVHNMQRHQIRKENKLYKVFDFNMLKDILNIKTMIQLVIGSKNYQRLRYQINKVKKIIK